MLENGAAYGSRYISSLFKQMDIKSQSDKILGFVKKGNYHAAINIALSGLNECRRNNDQAGIDRFISLIRGVALLLSDEFGSKEYLNQSKDEEKYCLICGAKVDKAQLVFEANGALCAECVDTVNK